MKTPIQIDLCQFVAGNKGLFHKPIPQKFWHIQETPGIPGHRCKSFCGDIGQIHHVGVVTYRIIRARRSVEICFDCIKELRARLEIKLPKENKAIETDKPQEAA